MLIVFTFCKDKKKWNHFGLLFFLCNIYWCDEKNLITTQVCQYYKCCVHSIEFISKSFAHVGINICILFVLSSSHFNKLFLFCDAFKFVNSKFLVIKNNNNVVQCL